MAGLTRKVAYLLMLSTLGLASLPGCRRTSDESRVRDSIKAVAAASESAAANDVVAPLSDDFDGNGGELDRRMLANLVRISALRGERIGVTVGPISIEHRGKRMVATFVVTLTSSRRLLPDLMGLYQIESAWRKEDGEWRCYSANWKHAM